MSAQTSARRRKATARGARRSGAATMKPRAVEFGREQFRLTCRRVRGPVKLPKLNLDDVATSCEWTRQGSAMSGTLELGRPYGKYEPGLIVKGDVVRLEVAARPGAKFQPLWEMAVTDAGTSPKEGARTITMKSRLDPAARTKRGHKYRKNKAHPRGWTADQITRHVCRRFRLKIGKLPKGKHRITKLVDKSADPIEIVTQAWAEERKATGQRYDVSVRRGLVDVTPLRRPRYMLMLGSEVIDAVLEDTLPKDFASAVIVTSTVKRKGSKKRRKVRAKVVDRARVKRYGYIVKNVTKDGLESAAECRRYGRRWLARDAKPLADAELTVPGIPWVDRGDAVKVKLPDGFLTGVVYLTEATHRLTYASYEMELKVTMKDPWEADEKAARVRRKKAAAKRRRARTRRQRQRGDHPQPAKAKARR